MLKIVILSLVSSLATILTLFLFHVLVGSRKPMKLIEVKDDNEPDIKVVITKRLNQEKNTKSDNKHNTNSALVQQSKFIYKKNIKIKFSREFKNIITHKFN